MKKRNTLRVLAGLLVMIVTISMLPVNVAAAEIATSRLADPIPVEGLADQDEETGSAGETKTEDISLQEEGKEEIVKETVQEEEIEDLDGDGSSENGTDESETDETSDQAPVTDTDDDSSSDKEKSEATSESESDSESALDGEESEAPSETNNEPESNENNSKDANENKADQKPVEVTVTITGKTLTAEYTGERISVNGYAVESSAPEIVPISAISLADDCEAVASGIEPGEYLMNLSEKSFSVDVDDNIKVILKVIDGVLTITEKEKTGVSVEVSVRWDDDNDRDRIRPDYVEVKLLANGEETSEDLLVLNAENDWTGKWTGIPETIDGKQVTYTVEEIKSAWIGGDSIEIYVYDWEASGNAEDGFVITNTHIPFDGSMTMVPVRRMAKKAVPGTAILRGAGDIPQHSKTATSNDDGTYKLELSVTGDADDNVQEAGGVNVVVVYDVSQSMTSNAGSSRNSRADQAEDVVHDFLTNLAGYQNAAKDNIRVSLVTFAVTGSQAQGWTTDVAGLANRFDDNGTDGRTNFSYTGYGTNWESALQRAQTLVDGVRNEDPVFVVMITDGAPTASGNGGNAIAPTGATIAQLRERYNAATDEARSIASSCEDTNGTFYGIYAYGTEADLLDDLMYFSQNGQHRNGSINNVIARTEEAPNYFNAGETAQLQEAIDEIFDKVVQAMGISSARISDGTTHSVETSTGKIAELLEVDESSYQYWLSIPVVGNKFSRVDRDGNTVEYTVTDNGDGTCTVTWGSNSVTVDGSVSNGQLKYEWKKADALYNYAPPAASFSNSAVDWNLSPVGTLLDGVTYSVTFDVYPSQETLDIVADIKNEPGEDGAWGDLDSEIQQYITVDGELQTNTTATLSYTDTRTGQSGSSTYDNPDPVENTAVEQLAISKKWENELDGQAAKPVTLNVTRDGDPHYTVKLNSSNNWEDTVFISIGIMGTDGEPLKGSEGHDFSFTEPQELTYHWELDVPTVHPMLINNAVTMLIKVDDKHPAPEGAKTYTIKGATYYVGDTGAASLTATNHRRSSLLLTKVVQGTGAPADAVFPFTLNVENSLAPETKPAEEDDPDHESDWWVWVSVRDKNNSPVTDAVTSGAVADGSSGWYYGESGVDIALNVKAGYSIRINSLPTGTTYTFTEGTLPQAFIFKEAKLSIAEGTGADSTFSGGVTTTGTIEDTNTLYQVTYTNEYTVVDVTVDKVWDDANDQDGVRPTSLSLTLIGLPAGTTAPDPTISKDGNKWTYKWEKLPKYGADGREIAYTVTEDTVPSSYTVSGSPASDKGTITNKYTPETVNVKVTKVWDDNDDQDGIRPDSVKIHLLADGTAVKEIELPYNGSLEYTFTDLPKKKSGTAITYSVTEDAVTGYKDPVITGGAADGFIVTNTHEPKKITIEGTKIWDDADDQDKKRPETITINLLANGEQALDETGEPVSAVVSDVDGEWNWKFENLPEKKNGEAIEYSIEEEQIDGYEDPVIAGNAANGFTVTNKYVPETTELTVEKVWEDNDNQDGVRPSEVVVRLLADNKEVKNAALNERNQWSATFSELPVYNKGKEIVYTLTEDALNGYKSAIETKEEGEKLTGFTVTNTHEPGVTSVSVSKVWEDEEDADGKRPNSVVVVLKADGQIASVDDARATLSDENKWAYTWKELPEKAGGKAIEYTVDESSVPAGYEKSIAGNALKGFTITNTHEPEKTSIKVTKKWEDANDQDGKRPGSVTINLLADGDKIASKTISNDTGWKCTFEDLPSSKGGKIVVYTIEEVKVNEYQSAISGGAEEGFTVTNTYKPQKTAVEGKKIWDDENNKDKTRPAEITVNLLKNGTVVESKKVTESDGWKFSFTDLDKYEKGKEIIYTVTENSVTKYSTSVSGDAKKGFTITNTYKPEEEHHNPPDKPSTPSTPPTVPEEKMNIPIVKLWSDNNNAAGKRPASITVVLAADGVLTGDKLVLSDANEWKGVFTDLPVWKAGNRIQYTVLEDLVPGYVPAILGDKDTGFTLVNRLATVPTAINATGDDSLLGVYGMISVVSLFAIVGCLLFWRREKKA